MTGRGRRWRKYVVGGGRKIVSWVDPGRNSNGVAVEVQGHNGTLVVHRNDGGWVHLRD